MADSPRTLDQIIASLGSIYDPQINSVRSQEAALPGQQATDEAQLDAKKQTSFDDIMNQSRARGVGFGGIPLGDQAKYLSTDYLPAVAKLRTAYVTQKNSLEDMLNQINERRFTNANQIHATEQDYYLKQLEQERLAADSAAQRAAARAASAGASPTFGGGNYSAPAAPQQAPSVSAQQQRDYNFVKGLIGQVASGNGNATTLILKQAREGDARSKDIMRAFYQLQNKAIPAGFRSFL